MVALIGPGSNAIVYSTTLLQSGAAVEDFAPAVLRTHRSHVEIRIGVVSTHIIPMCRSRDVAGLKLS